MIHAANVLPALPAAPVYRSRRSLDSRSSYRSVSPLSMGGRPLGRLAGSDMGLIMPVQIIVDKPSVWVFNARTVNQPTERQMTQEQRNAANDAAKTAERLSREIRSHVRAQKAGVNVYDAKQMSELVSIELSMLSRQLARAFPGVV